MTLVLAIYIKPNNRRFNKLYEHVEDHSKNMINNYTFSFEKIKKY